MSKRSNACAAFLIGFGGASCSTASHREGVDTTDSAFSSPQRQKLVAADPGKGDRFGSSVAVSGNSIFAAAPFDYFGAQAERGSVYVFGLNGSTWSQSDKLATPDGSAFDRFGGSLAVSADTVLIGAEGSDGPIPNQGAAYVFVRSGSSFSVQQRLVASDAASNTRFGASVAVSGDTAAVAANDATYVFARTGTTWVETQKLSGPGRSIPPSLAMSDDTILAGFMCDATAAFSCRGSVSVYVRSGSIWIEQQRLASGDLGGDRFGNPVALFGDTALVAATGISSQRGAVYVFVRSGSTWAVQQTLIGSDTFPDNRFGSALSLAENVALIGPAQHTHPGIEPRAGSAYVFTRSGSTWTQRQERVSSDGQNNDFFGSAVALSGSTMVIAAPNDDGIVQAQGSAYVFQIQRVNGDPCALPSDCPSGFCSDGRCCDSACEGSCNACSFTAGARRDGECTLLPAGSPGSPPCAPLVCSGNGPLCEAVATCGSCESDLACASGDFCSSIGVCQPRKGQGRACEPTAGADCRSDGCRVCATGSCVDGFCCDTPCAGSCSACANMLTGAPNGTCAPERDCGGAGTGGSSGGGGGTGGTGATGGSGGAGGSGATGGAGGTAGTTGGGSAGTGGTGGTGGNVDCIRVAPDGDDALASANDGATPFRNVQPAIDFADSHRDISTVVCIAAGPECGPSTEYPGPAGNFRMRDAITVRGKYESTTWTRCADASTTTTLSPLTSNGVLFDASITHTTTLDGVSVKCAPTDTTAAITVDGARGVELVNVTLPERALSPMPSFAYGIDVRNHADVAIRASTIVAPVGVTAIALRSVASRITVTDGSQLSATGPSTVNALRLEDSQNSAVFDSELFAQQVPGGVEPLPPTTAVVINGLSEDVMLVRSSIISTPGRSGGLGILATGCFGTAPEITDCSLEVRLTPDVYFNPTATGVSSSDCNTRVVSSDVVVLVGASAQVADYSVVGISCSGACVLDDNRIETLSSAPGPGSSVASVGIECDGCTEINDNELAGHSVTRCFRDCRYDSVGLFVIGSPIGTLVDANIVDPGCAGGPQGGNGIGLEVSGNVRVQNNVVRGTDCDYPTGGVESVGVDLTGAVDLHSNFIEGGSFDAGLCHSTALRFGSGGVAEIRNNILAPGRCALGLSVDQTSVGPAALLLNNDFVPRASGEIAYRIQGADDPRSIEAVNALPNASGNFLAVCALPLTPPSACIGTGTPDGVPDHDADGEPRSPLFPDVGPDEFTGPEPGPFVQLSASGFETCGLRASGLVECWGNFNPSIYGMPADEVFSVISVGREHVCVLRLNDTVGCWGQVPPSPPSGAFQELSAGGFHDCALTPDNTVACWGDDAATRSVPTGIFDTIASGFTHSCGLRPDGSLTCWGDNWNGQTDAPPGAFRSVCSGYVQSCGLRLDGTIDCWGDVSWLQDWAPPPSGSFAAVFCGGTFACALDAGGGLACWGQNFAGQRDALGGTFESVALGWAHGCGLPSGNPSDDKVVCWGDNQFGESNPPE